MTIIAKIKLGKARGSSQESAVRIQEIIFIYSPLLPRNGSTELRRTSEVFAERLNVAQELVSPLPSLQFIIHNS